MSPALRALKSSDTQLLDLVVPVVNSVCALLTVRAHFAQLLHNFLYGVYHLGHTSYLAVSSFLLHWFRSAEQHFNDLLTVPPLKLDLLWSLKAIKCIKRDITNLLFS